MRRDCVWFLAALVLAVVVGLGVRPGSASADDGGAAGSEVTIDCSSRLQVIDGFGSSLFGGFAIFERGQADGDFPEGVTFKTTPAQRKAIVTAMVQELGVTHVRIFLPPPGVEPHNDNDDPNLINPAAFDWDGDSSKPAVEMSKALYNRNNGLNEWGDILKTGVPLGLKNWIPTPGWMPEWLQYKLKNAEPGCYEEYAEWAAAQLLYLKKTFGVEAPYWSMHNEPDNMGLVDAHVWIAWMTATGKRFRKEGLKTRIVFPDYMDVYQAVPLVREVMANDEVRPYIGALAYHHYRSSGDDPKVFLSMAANPSQADSGGHYDRVTGGAKAMAALAKQYGVPSWQTETAYYSQPMTYLTPWQIGMGRANEVYYELVSGASAVETMLAIWIKDSTYKPQSLANRFGGHILLHSDGTRVTEWTVTKDCGAVFAHYGRYVRPGDQRVAANSPDPQLRVTAFVADKGKQYVAVVVNNSPHLKRVTLKLEKLPWAPRFSGALLTDEKRTLAVHGLRAVDKAKGVYESELPGLSVCTMVWSSRKMSQFAMPESVRLENVCDSTH